MFADILKKYARLILTGVLVIGVAFALVGCGDDSVVGDDDDDDGGTTTTSGSYLIDDLSLESSGTVEPNTQYSLTGNVEDSLGEGVGDVQVLFSVSPSDQGYFVHSADTSSSDGSFAGLFVALDTGSVILRAELGSDADVYATRTVSVSGDVTTQDPSAAAFNWTVPDGFILADGDDQISVSVAIYTDQDSPVANGTVVKLACGERFDDVNGDGYFTENVDEVTWDANENGIWDKIGSVPSVVTTVDSVATFSYTSGTEAGYVFIRATIGDASDATWDEFALVLRPSEDVSYIKLSAANPDIQVKATGGIESTNLTAYCYDKYGNPVQQDIPVDFYIISGPNGGENIEEQGYGPVSAMTNVLGAATVSMLSGTISGTISAQAKVGTITSDVVLVNVNAGPPYRISVGVDPCNIRGCGWVNVKSDVVALVEDVYDNPVMDSTVVYFTTNTIGMVDASSVTTGGIATSEFRSTADCIDGRARIIAETDGGQVKDSTLLLVTGYPAYVDIYSYPTTLFADGKSYGKVYVEVLDGNSNYVLNGEQVEFDFYPEGTISDATTSDGCYASVAVSKFITQVLEMDYSYTVPDDGIGAYGQLTATSGVGAGVSDAVTIVLTTGYAHSDKSEINISGKISPGSSEPLWVEIKDRPGNPLGGHALTAYASLGTVDADGNPATVDTVYTNEFGEAVGWTYTAPSQLGNAYITITDHDPRGNIILTMKIKIDVEE